MERSREPFLRKLREAHRTFATPDTRLVAEVRDLVRGETELVAHDAGRTGLEEARDLAGIVDGVVVAHLEALAPEDPLAALALGGYGRGELSPYSDVDLMILVEDGAASAREAAGALVRFLWDVGFQVGHAVRTLTETAEVLRHDVASATAVLEARFLHGDRDLHRRLGAEVVRPYLAESRETYLEAKLREMAERHRFYGGSPCIVEPNVKESPGGLRDMHVAQWIARARTGRRDFSELREAGVVDPATFQEVLDAYSTMHRVRHALHRLAGRRQDVLDAGTQPRAALALGFRDGEGRVGAEDLMRTVTGAALRLHRFLEEVVAFHESARGGPVRGVERREIAAGFVAVGEGLFLARPDVFEGEGAARRMMRAFFLAQRLRLRPGEEVILGVRRRAVEEGEALRADGDVVQTFRTLLQGRRGVAPMLRAMHRAGLLGEMLPEFGALTGLVRIDGYHRYTVDEHSLRTVEALEGFEDDDGFLRDELRQVLRPDLLRLAALLHDIGKAAGPDHEAAGANRIVDVARRLAFGEDETKLLHRLLRHHTLLAETADRRVLEGEVDRVAEAAGSAGRLRMLLLLNVADVLAVGRESLSDWRLQQIRGLYERARAVLEALPPERGRERSFEEDLVAAAGPGRQEAARVHASLVPSRYRLEVDPATAARHLDLVERLRTAPAAVLLRPAGSAGELWIASRDQPARFAELAGVLTAAGLDVRSATAYTRQDGIVLDVFHVADEEGRPVEDEAVASRIERHLSRARSGTEDLEQAVRRRKARFRPAKPRPPVPVTVTFSSKVSREHTVVDVVTADRPGLLYDLARCVSSHGLDIRFARIATRGHRVADAFYLAGPGGRIEDEERLRRLRDDLLVAARESSS